MTPDILVVLAAGMTRVSSGWASTDLTEKDSLSGAPGGRLRVVAASVLAKKYPNATVVASGGKGYDVPPGARDDRPLLADMMSNELVEQGVSAARVLRESSSNTTFQQVEQLEQLLAKHHWRNVWLITNQWHVPRVRALIDVKFPGIAVREDIRVISAEDVLCEDDAARWAGLCEAAYASSFLKQRVVQEAAGIRQIYDGTYIYR